MLLIILVIFGVGFGFFLFNPERFFGVYNLWFQKTNKLLPPVDAPKGEVSTYKGFWMPCSFMNDGCQPMNNTELLKEMNVNIIGIAPKIVINSKGEINYFPMEFMEKRLSQIVNKYHSEEIRVFISPELGFSESLDLGGGEPKPIPREAASTPGFLDKYDILLADLAKLAEKYHVEIFSPMNEPDMKLGNGVVSAWAQNILPVIKSNYTGKTLWKVGRGDNAGNEITFKGYDILGIDFTAHGGDENQSLADFPSTARGIIDGALAWAKRDGIETVFLTEVGVWGGTIKFSDQGKAMIHRIIFQEGQGKVRGFVILDPPPDQGWSIKNTKSMDEIKTWFTEKLN
ncbi:MAG: hypothetical protein M1365_08185 [Actinobacteria bacterium]|nr:hypothetical protein [Actinomycetota bacterium]